MSGKHSQDKEQNSRITHSQYYETKQNKGGENAKMKGQKRKKSNNKLDIFFKLIAFAFVVITIIFYISVLKMDLLPGLYVTIFTIAEIVFTLAMVVGLVKKHRTYKITILCFIIVLFLSGIYIYVTNYTLATSDFLGNVFQEKAETEDYYVVVRKASSYNEVEDIANKTVYYFQIEDDVQSELENKVDVQLEAQNSLTELGNDLLDEELDVIFISASQHAILSEEIENFEQDTKIIYTATHEIEKIIGNAGGDSSSKYTVENGIFNVMISGIDTAGSIRNVGRSDANIIVTINTNTHEVLLTSIPRDYYVTLHSKQAKDKLTHSGIYGINETVTTVEDLLDIDINYYVRVNFSTVEELVDTLGGIEVYSDYNFTTTEGYHFNKGYNYINGEEALAFSRERQAFSAGDNQRVKNQQHVIEAIMKKVLNSSTILTKYTSILNALEDNFQTNIAQNEISSLVKEQLNNMSSWSIKSNSLVGTGASRTTYSLGNVYSYVMIPDSDSVDEAKQEIKNIMGE